jgi:hypothetical protein
MPAEQISPKGGTSREEAAHQMTFGGDPEKEFEAPCPACGCRQVFTGVAPPGERENPLFPRCCQCGRERDDLLHFYEIP